MTVSWPMTAPEPPNISQLTTTGAIRRMDIPEMVGAHIMKTRDLLC